MIFSTLGAKLADLRPLNLLNNFHWIEPGMAARAGQPSAGVLPRLLRSNGIKAMINLRGANPEKRWWRSEKAICGQLGVSHFEAKLNSRQIPTRAMLQALLEAFDEAPRPLLMKCRGGSDRTSFASALYFLHGESHPTKVWHQFSRFPFLHFPRKNQMWLREFVSYARSQMKDQSLLAWVRASYVPAEFAKWLDDRDLEDSYDGLFSDEP